MNKFRITLILFFLCALPVFGASKYWDKQISKAQLKMELAYSAEDSKDTWNLRENADFEVEVAEGVWWVPANSLGSSRYTNKQIAAIVNEDPKVKKALIGNLYEAIQLYQISDFVTDSNQGRLNVRVVDSYNNYDWEKHCPGYYAVLLNRGNCSTCTNWLIYLLEDDMEEWGTFHYQEADGGGHVINYFFVDGYYYIIDMTHYRNDFHIPARSAVENGDYNTYLRTDFISANIHKAVSLEAYVDYCLDVFNEKPTIFYTIKGHEAVDLTSDSSKNPVNMVFDEKIKNDFKLVYIDDSKMTYGFYRNSTKDVNWDEKTRHPYASITTF